MAPFLSPLNQGILRLALPTILMNISIPLLGAVDTAVVGHLPGVEHLGAVGLGSLIFTLVYWVLGFFRMSTVGLAAQSHGRGDAQETADVLGRALLLALVLGSAVILLRHPIASVALHFFEATPETEHHAGVYFNIRVFAAPAAFVLMIFQGWYYGVGNVAYPVALTVLINGLNIVLDLLFVNQWGFASDGVAWATLISQYLGLAAALALFRWRYRDTMRRFSPERLLSWPKMRVLLNLNFDIFVRTLGLQAANVYFIAKSTALGDAVLGANIILLQMRHIAAYALDGFATAAEVTVGQAIGAGERARVLATIRAALVWGMIVGALIALIFGLLSPWWPGWFTSNPRVLALVLTYQLWVIAEPTLNNLCFMLDGIYVGATATRRMRNGMVIAVVLVFLPAIEILGHYFGNHGMWAAGLLLYLARALTLAPPLVRLHRGEGVVIA